MGDELKDGHLPAMVEEEEGDQSKIENKVKECELERTNLSRAEKSAEAFREQKFNGKCVPEMSDQLRTLFF